MPEVGQPTGEGPPSSAWRRSLGLAVIAALLLVAVGAAGALSLRQAAVLTPATTVPATITSTYVAVPQPYTAATITGVGLPLGGLTPTTVLTLQHGPSPWSVKLVATAKSGFGALDSVTLALVGPTSSAITLTSASGLPHSTAAVALGTSSDLTVTAQGVCVGTCTMTLQLQLTSTGSGAVPVIVYPVTLAVT